MTRSVEGGRRWTLQVAAWRRGGQPKSQHGRGAEEATLACWGIAPPWHPWSHAPIWVKLAAKATSPRDDSIAVQEGHMHTPTQPDRWVPPDTTVPEVFGSSPAPRRTTTHHSTPLLSTSAPSPSMCLLACGLSLFLLRVTCSAKPPVTDGDDDHGNGLDLFLSLSFYFSIYPTTLSKRRWLEYYKKKKRAM